VVADLSVEKKGSSRLASPSCLATCFAFPGAAGVGLFFWFFISPNIRFVGVAFWWLGAGGLALGLAGSRFSRFGQSSPRWSS